MSIGLIFNITGFLLTLVACFAISKNYDVLKNVAFSSGKVKSISVPQPTIEIHIGLRAVAVDNPTTNITGIYNFDALCDNLDGGLNIYRADEDCNACKEVSASLVSTLILSLVTYFPSIFTNVLRMYPNYDVNCQKIFGVFVTMFSMVSALYTWQGYANDCFRGFYDGLINFDSDQQVIESSADSNDIFLSYDADWKAGAGYICLVVAVSVYNGKWMNDFIIN